MSGKDTVMQGAALFAMAASVGAVLWIRGADSDRSASSGSQASSYWADVETGEDHIDAMDLARRMLAGTERIAIVDVRPRAEFEQFHLRGAVSMSVPQLVGDEGARVFASHPDLVVVCSNGPAHPAQAWVELRRQGHDNVRVLDGGLDEMKRAVFTPPTLASDVDEATAAQRRVFVELARQALIAQPSAVAAKSDWATDPAKLTGPAIVSALWAATHKDVVLVDVRSAAAYASLHAVASISLDLSSLRERHGDRDLLLLPAEALAKRFGDAGIAIETPVAILADRMHDAALAALAFLRTGHRAVAIVEGGIRSWPHEGLPLDSDEYALTPTAHGVVAGADNFTMSVEELAAFVEERRGVVIDSRPTAQFAGEQGQEARRGHVPGAKNRPIANDFDAQGRLLPRAALEAAFSSLGATNDAQAALMCRTGHQAAQQLFVLRFLLGYDKVKWCNGSFTQWAERAELPVELGAER
ncbi:MAG: hypothetical protein RLZZ562_162 [Planctomycetota bacterium]|jgi:thiosulfate/3-mercaptopyruvate sulfurtransferase